MTDRDTEAQDTFVSSPSCTVGKSTKARFMFRQYDLRALRLGDQSSKEGLSDNYLTW